MVRKLALGILALILAAYLMGCGNSGSETSSASVAAVEQVPLKYSSAADNGNIIAPGAEGSVMVTTANVKAEGAGSEGETAKVRGSEQQNSVQNSNIAINISQKIIFTGQVNFETLEFEKTRTALCNYMSSIGAYQQNSSVKGGGIGYEGLKSAVYVFRVPKTKYDQSFIDLRKFGTVVFEQSSGEDVTDQYFDTEARLKSLKIQQERLLELLKKAVKMEDILKIEKELQTTNYDIENLTGTLKKWDSLVEYSTLTVNINEVEQIKPVQPKEKDGFLYRISSGFKNSVSGLWRFIQDAIVFFAAALPVIIPLGAIGFVIYKTVRRKSRKPGEEGKPVTPEEPGASDPGSSEDISEK